MRQRMVRYVSSLVRWLSTMKYLNRWIVLVLDLSLSLLSAVVSYLLVLAFLQIQFNRESFIVLFVLL